MVFPPRMKTTTALSRVSSLARGWLAWRTTKAGLAAARYTSGLWVVAPCSGAAAEIRNMAAAVAARAGPRGTAFPAVVATPGATMRMSSRMRTADVEGLWWGSTTRQVVVIALELGRTLVCWCCAPHPPPLRPVPTSQAEEDPVDQFFSFSDSGRALSMPPRTDYMQLEMENAVLEALDTTLAFEDDSRSPPPPPAWTLGLRSWKARRCFRACCPTSTPPRQPQ